MDFQIMLGKPVLDFAKQDTDDFLDLLAAQGMEDDDLIDPVEELVVVYFAQMLPANGLDDQAKLRALVYQAIMDGE